MKVDLSTYRVNKNDYRTGKNLVVRVFWLLISKFCVNSWFPISSVKIFCLRIFGAKIGRGAVIKPYVNVKYPWKLKIADHVWIGEGVWIDNLTDVVIDSNVCISQGVYLLCGNHNYKISTFDLMLGTIQVKEGVWIGAKSIICPGSRLDSHSVICAGSVFSGIAEEYTVYSGNPAAERRKREIR